MNNTYTTSTTSSTTSYNTNRLYGTYERVYTSGYSAYSIPREVSRPTIIIDEIPYFDFLNFKKQFFPEIKKKITNWREEIEK